MKYELSAVFAIEGETGILRAHALFRGLGENFVLRSTASKFFEVDPGVPLDRLLAEFPENRGIVFESRNHRSQTVIMILSGGRAAAVVDFFPGALRLDILSADRDADTILNRIADKLSRFRLENKEDDGVWLNFTYRTAQGPTQHPQFIRCPTWEDIRDNYVRETREGIERLIGTRNPWDYGRLIIWYGPPGTGKTFALRALLMEWRETFDFLVVTDPERLAEDPSYYYDLVSSRGVVEPWILKASNEAGNVKATLPRHKRRKRYFFIFEDAADLVIAESRSAHYDKIGKLLNLTDGFIGQGREDLFLVTFNEAIEEIDPAFLRPGRCLSHVQFRKFPPAQAMEWLKRKGEEKEPVDDDMTLAELYVRIRGKQEAAVAQRKIGYLSGNGH